MRSSREPETVQSYITIDHNKSAPRITNTSCGGSGYGIQYTYDDDANAVGSELTREGFIGYAYDLNGRRTSVTILRA